jgi:putative transcriptional regulator
MKSPKPRRPLAERLKTAMEEGIRHARGEITLRTTVVELPDEPPEIDAPTLVALRDQARMSQAVFARLLNVSTKTVQSWEQGVRTPSHASRRLIQVFSLHPESVCRSVGVTPISLQGVTIRKLAAGRSQLVIERAPIDRKPRNTTSGKKKAFW